MSSFLHHSFTQWISGRDWHNWYCAAKYEMVPVSVGLSAPVLL